VGGPPPAGLGLTGGFPGPRRRRAGRVRYRKAVTVWETVFVFAVVPLAGLALLTALTFAPGASRGPRYRVGKPWDHEPVWYVPRPDVDAPAGSAEGRAALAAAVGRPALPGGVPAAGGSTVVDADTGTARGGASGEW
jgi:hypothetical protein